MTIKKILSDEYYYVRIYDYLEIELPEVKEAVETEEKEIRGVTPRVEIVWDLVTEPVRSLMADDYKTYTWCCSPSPFTVSGSRIFSRRKEHFSWNALPLSDFLGFSSIFLL